MIWKLSQVLYTVWCNVSGEAAGEIWHWSLLWKGWLCMHQWPLLRRGIWIVQRFVHGCPHWCSVRALLQPRKYKGTDRLYQLIKFEANTWPWVLHGRNQRCAFLLVAAGRGFEIICIHCARATLLSISWRFEHARWEESRGGDGEYPVATLPAPPAVGDVENGETTCFFL